MVFKILYFNRISHITKASDHSELKTCHVAETTIFMNRSVLRNTEFQTID